MLKHPQNTPSDQSPQTRKVRPVRLVGLVRALRGNARVRLFFSAVIQ